MKITIVYTVFLCLIIMEGILACVGILLSPLIYWTIFSGSFLLIITGVLKRHFVKKSFQKLFYFNLTLSLLFLLTVFGRFFFQNTYVTFEDDYIIVEKQENNILLLSCGSDFYVYKKTFYGYRVSKLISNKDCIVELEKVLFDVSTGSYKIYVNNLYKVGYYEFSLNTGFISSRTHKPDV